MKFVYNFDYQRVINIIIINLKRIVMRKGNSGDRRKKSRYSQLMGYLGVGDFASAKQAAQSEQISPQTEKMLRFMAPSLPCIYEIVRIIARRSGFKKYQKELVAVSDSYEGNVILSNDWDKLKIFAQDAPFCQTNLWAFVCTVRDNMSNPQAEEVFRFYNEKYGFGALPPTAVTQRILTEIKDRYNL